jgi:molybdopterin converting factor small subunit
MRYNTERPRLIISEYGRNIQQMIDDAVKIENRDERNKVAQYIISVMGQLNPQLRDVADFKHKLWDHLFIMSDFKLDVDSPYPIPSKESFQTKPEQLKYPNNQIKFRHYGKIVEKLIDKASELNEGPEKEQVVSAIAHQLKKSYLLWNRDSVDDDIIMGDLQKLSGGNLKLSEGTKLASASEVIGAQSFPQQQGKKFHRKSQKQNKFKRKFGSSNSY